MRRAAFLLGFIFLAGCAEKPPAPPERLSLRRVTFAELNGWGHDRQAEALPALLRSCEAISKKPAEASLGGKGVAGSVRDWQPACDVLKTTPPQTDNEARRFLETWFAPYALSDEPTGLFTGYYEAELRGAWRQGGHFQTPLWQRPDDLVTVNLGDFRPELEGQRLAGKVEEHKLRPYDDRAAVAKGTLTGRAKPLLWTDDPVDAFFLEIQGSGRAHMPNGQTMRVGYDAQNGKAYVPIGRLLAEEGEIEKPVTMAKIRDWLRTHPECAQAVMDRNPSVVFFRRLEGEGPVGAEGVALTPERSLAVDAAFVPLGVPLWLVLEKDDNGVIQPPRLVVAQDTGGAIKGPVRGDLFWGAGAEAEAQAGAMQSRGTYYLLLPKTVMPNAAQ